MPVPGEEKKHISKRHLQGAVIDHLAEIEARGRYLQRGISSLFDYAVRELHCRRRLCSPVAFRKEPLQRSRSACHDHEGFARLARAHQNAPPFQVVEPVHIGLTLLLDGTNLCHRLAMMRDGDRRAGAHQPQYLREAHLGFVE